MVPLDILGDPGHHRLGRGHAVDDVAAAVGVVLRLVRTHGRKEGLWVGLALGRPQHDIDARLRLRVVDVKLTSEPGAHYFAKVVYYSMTLASWLIEGRPESVAPLLRLLGRATPAEEAIRRTFGMSVEALESRLLRWVAEDR